jgi:hypothetical protein
MVARKILGAMTGRASEWYSAGMATPTDPATMQLLEKAAARNLRDYVESTRRAAPSVGPAYAKCGQGTAAYMGVGSPLTTVKGTGPELGEEEIEAAESFFRSRGAERATFEAAPWLSTESQQRLETRGYRVLDYEDVVIRRPPFSAPHPSHAVALVEVEAWPELQLRVNDAAESQSWRAIVEACAILPDAIRFGIRDSTGEWIACAELVPAEGVAIFSNDATVPRATGRGAQTALIQERLRTAGAMGFACAAAEVAPGSRSERNYLRCGFEIAYQRKHYARKLD